MTNALWKSLFHGEHEVVGKKLRIGREWKQVAAVLPASFHFLSRQPAAYLIEPVVPDAQLMVVGRIKPGVSQQALDKELTRIAETACYYFFRSELRYSFLKEAAWIPLKVFAIAAIASAFLVIAVSRVSVRRLWSAFKAADHKALARRIGFFTAKIALAFLLLFMAALEWSRSSSAILYGSRDPAAGPFLLWLYILGSMGALFWAIADQRARCRVCLRLLCFPVRIGCPGCLLLIGPELSCFAPRVTGCSTFRIWLRAGMTKPTAGFRSTTPGESYSRTQSTIKQVQNKRARRSAPRIASLGRRRAGEEFCVVLQNRQGPIRRRGPVSRHHRSSAKKVGSPLPSSSAERLGATPAVSHTRASFHCGRNSGCTV